MLAAVDRIIPCHPDDLITLFVGGMPRYSRDAVWEACGRDETFAHIPQDRWVPVLGLIWPVKLIRPALDFIDTQNWTRDFTADDEIVGRVRQALMLDLWATVPNLVEHPDNVESLVGIRMASYGNDPDRMSCCWIGPDDDPLDIPWS